MSIRLLIIKNDQVRLTEVISYIKKENFNINEILTNVLHEPGIPSNIKGYKYLKCAIMNGYQQGTLLTLNLYQQIAIIYDTKAINVESAIRHAIEIAWLRGNLEYINLLFGSSISYEKTRPTNTEFIDTIIDVLRSKNI